MPLFSNYLGGDPFGGNSYYNNANNPNAYNQWNANQGGGNQTHLLNQWNATEHQGGGGGLWGGFSDSHRRGTFTDGGGFNGGANTSGQYNSPLPPQNYGPSEYRPNPVYPQPAHNYSPPGYRPSPGYPQQSPNYNNISFTDQPRVQYPQGASIPDLGSYGTIDKVPTFLLDIGIGGPYPGEAGYNYGNSMSSGFYGPLGGAYDPMSNLFGPGGGGFNPFGPSGPYGPQIPNPYMNLQTDVNRTLFKPGSAWNPVAAAGVGFGTSYLTGGNGIWGGAGALGGSLIGKTDTSQGLFGGLISAGSSFFMNGGMNLFKPASSFEGDDAEEQQAAKQQYMQQTLGKVLPDVIGGIIGGMVG